MSNRVQKIYESTKVCVPKGFDICQDPEKLWNSTFIELENEVYQLVFYPNQQFNELKGENGYAGILKCFKGEPDLEKLMAYGKVADQFSS